MTGRTTSDNLLRRKRLIPPTKWKSPDNENLPNGAYSYKEFKYIIKERFNAGKIKIRSWDSTNENIGQHCNSEVTFLAANKSNISWNWKPFASNVKLPDGAVVADSQQSKFIYLGKNKQEEIGIISWIDESYKFYKTLDVEPNIYADVQDVKVLCVE